MKSINKIIIYFSIYAFLIFSNAATMQLYAQEIADTSSLDSSKSKMENAKKIKDFKDEYKKEITEVEKALRRVNFLKKLTSARLQKLNLCAIFV